MSPDGFLPGERHFGAASPEWLERLPTSVDGLRDYQTAELCELAKALRASSRVLLQLPTGGGKTHLIAAVTAAASSAGLSVLILATRTRLVRQIHERLESFGIRHGVIAAPLPALVNYSATIQIAAADTLYRRALVAEKRPLPPADVVLFDEAHLAPAQSRRELLDRYPAAKIIGLTATPARKSGAGLGEVFGRLVKGPSVRELIQARVLATPRVFSTPLVSESELKDLPRDTARDYATGALSGLLSRPKLVGDVVENWTRIANGKRTICFCVDKRHGAALVADFLRAGVAAELLTDRDSEAAREDALRRLEAGTTRILVNCFLLSYGLDLPSVECVVLARPTRSLAMYLQMVGRGLRPAEGKTHCLIIDHGRVVESLGLPQSDFDWSLPAGRNANAEASKSRAARLMQDVERTCPDCASVWMVSDEGPICPNCGWKPVPKAREVIATEAELEELAERKPKVDPMAPQVVQFHRESLGWYVRRWPQRWTEKPRGAIWWAWMKAVERFGLPAGTRAPVAYWSYKPSPPSQETAGWLQSRLIRWAKSRRRAA